MSSLLEEAYAPPLPQPAAAAPQAPIPTYRLRRDIAGVETELVVETFDDRVLVVLTQSGKVGCLTQAHLPPVAQLVPPPAHTDAAPSALSALPPPPPATHLTPLLGAPPQPTLHELYVSQIATLVWWALQLARAPRRPVVVGLALKRAPRGPGLDDDDEGVDGDDERVRFAGVMDMVASWPGPASAPAPQ
ncbi:uncharacterized protein LOC62_04G006365 [Vanrija pseudolonga]|uniref:Proteasome assembly chaperone 3 n=1 Tax=Vanrija pseudolonga TaxID=143232 RepID=A0AAF0YAF6_9TREE|nr:hypothetical protein LOC62_04G006365 [Vanrija pseudolonga]